MAKVQDFWEIIASHLGAQVDEAGSIVLTGDHHTLTLAPMGENCVSIFTTQDNLVSSPLISFPLIDGFSLDHLDGSVTLISTYREVFQTFARIKRDGTFEITGPVWRPPFEPITA